VVVVVVVGRVNQDGALLTIPEDARGIGSPLQTNSVRSVVAFRSPAAILNRIVRKRVSAAFSTPKVAPAIAAVTRRDVPGTREANVCAPRVKRFERGVAVLQVWPMIVVTLLVDHANDRQHLADAKWIRMPQQTDRASAPTRHQTTVIIRAAPTRVAQTLAAPTPAHQTQAAQTPQTPAAQILQIAPIQAAPIRAAQTPQTPAVQILQIAPIQAAPIRAARTPQTLAAQILQIAPI